MGNIKFYGFVEDYENLAMTELSQVEIPANAHIVKDILPMDEKNLLLFTIPIAIIIMTIIIIKQARTGFLNKKIRKEIQQENIKKHNLDTPKKRIKYALKGFLIIYIAMMIFMFCITTIHEYIHAISASVMGYDTSIAIGLPMGGMTWTKQDMTKIQDLIFGLMPCIVLGFIPAFISIVMKVTKKNYLANWIIGLVSCIMIYTCGWDLINAYNIKNIPNDAYVGQTNSIYYWYKK